MMRRSTDAGTTKALQPVAAFTLAAAALLAGGAERPAAAGKNAGETNRPVTTLFAIGPNMGLVGFDNAQTLSGSKVAVTTELSRSSKLVSQPRGAALDHNGALYLVSGANRGSIAVFDNPLAANGGRRPDRSVFGPQSQIARSATGIAIDRDNGLLYVADSTSDLLVFDISSPEAFDGDVAPVRTFDVDHLRFRPMQMCFANGSLYLVNARGGTSDIFVFDNPGSLTGKVAPDRVITHQGFDNKIGVHVDAQDRLLVGVRGLGQVLIFNDAATLDGPATPDVELSISGADVDPQPSFAMTDSQDRLYVADATGNVVFSFDRASELASGARAADRTIDSSDLIAPNRLLVYEHE